MTESLSQILKPGQIFAGRYRVERFLAQGGNGAVFAAEQLSTEAPVAIKVLRPHIIESGDALKRFEFEAKVAGRVRSEFIVRVLDAGVEESTGTPYLVMELLEGVSLAKHVKDNGPIGTADTVAFFTQIAQGLDRAHRYTNKAGVAQPIVHRDLKPENLFLTVRDDGQRVIKILDFGIAKVISDSLVVSQGIHGTPLYMAYEQLSGGRVGPSTDVWALGLIAFFLLTGRPYWRAADKEEPTLAAVFAEVLNMPIVPPSERARELGVEPSWAPEFDAWFLRCVNREPAQRFARASDAASELAGALLGPGWSQTIPSAPITTHTPLAVPRGRGGTTLEDNALSRTTHPSGTSSENVRPKPFVPIAIAAAALLLVAVWRARSDGELPHSDERLRSPPSRLQQPSALPALPVAEPSEANAAAEPAPSSLDLRALPSASTLAPRPPAVTAPSTAERRKVLPVTSAVARPPVPPKAVPGKATKPSASAPPAAWVYGER